MFVLLMTKTMPIVMAMVKMTQRLINKFQTTAPNDTHTRPSVAILTKLSLVQWAAKTKR